MMHGQKIIKLSYLKKPRLVGATFFHTNGQT